MTSNYVGIGSPCIIVLYKNNHGRPCIIVLYVFLYNTVLFCILYFPTLVAAARASKAAALGSAGEGRESMAASVSSVTCRDASASMSVAAATSDVTDEGEQTPQQWSFFRAEYGRQKRQ